MEAKAADFRTFKPGSRNQMNELKIGEKRVTRASQALSSLEPGAHHTTCLPSALCNRGWLFCLTLRHSGSEND